MRLSVVSTVCTIAFAALCAPLAVYGRPAVDTWALERIHQLEHPVLDTAMTAITTAGSFLGLLVLLVSALFLMNPTRRQSVAALVVLCGGELLVTLLKVLFDQPRPDLWEGPAEATSTALPSGHAALSLALALTLLMIVQRPRGWQVAVAVGFLALMSFTRLYLGVHYPTDILAGWLLGAAWTCLVFTRTPRTTPES